MSIPPMKPIRPERILYEVRQALPPDGIVVTDVGWNKNGVGQQYPIYQPRTHLTPGGLATMGFGPAAALGAKLGRPQSPVVALVGDGAFSSTASAVTAAVENERAKVRASLGLLSIVTAAPVAIRSGNRLASSTWSPRPCSRQTNTRLPASGSPCQ